MIESFINKFPIKIYDNNNKLLRQLTFGKEIPKMMSNSTNIFTKAQININELKKYTKTGDTYYYPNILLFKCMSISEVLSLVMFLTEATDIRINGLTLDQDTNSIYQTVSIGNTELEFIVSRLSDNDVIYNNVPVFIDNYMIIIEYIKKLQNNVIKNINNHISINRITMRSVYTKSILNVSLPKIFNLLHVGKLFQKIIIHDDVLDEYYENSIRTQYIKTETGVKYPFKGTHTTFNLLTIYLNYKVSDKIYLTKVNINKLGNISHTYSILDSHYEWNNVYNDINDFISKRFIKEIVNELYIEEAIYTEFDKNNYIHNEIKSIDCICNMQLTKSVKIESINDLVSQSIPDMKYKTKTSLCVNGYIFLSREVINSVRDLLVTHDYITSITIKKLILPNIVISNYISNELIIKIQDANSWDNVLFNIVWILYRFPINSNSKDKILTAESILSKSQNIPPKSLLKLLEEVDYKLFGPRYVKGKIRPYSGLAQKNNQRVVPITLDEYEIVHKKFPDSVVNIENQSTGARLCLLCPYRTAPYINFHYSNGELCIPKCTLKQSNKTQYNVCAKQLNATESLKYDTVNENQTIVMYNPMISPGRKCYVPEEFELLFNNCYLLKLPETIDDIYEWTHKIYNIEPFIIERNIFEQKYYIYTEYDNNTDYCLIFQSEQYYLILVDKNFKLILFSKNSYVRNFFKNNSFVNSDYKNKFFNYISKIIHKNLSEEYNKSVNELLRHIQDKYNISYICDNDIIKGIIYKNKHFLTPNYYINNKQSIKLIDFRTYNFDKNNPTIDMFDIKEISALYRDYSTNQVYLIKYCEVITFIEPFKQIPYGITNNIITNDKEGFINNFYNFYNKCTSINSIEFADINYILDKWLYIFFLNTKFTDKLSVSELLNDINNFFRKWKLLGTNANIKYYNKYLLWRQSVLTQDILNNYLQKIFIDSEYFNLSDILLHLDKSIYKQINSDLMFSIESNEKITSKKITA